MTEVKRVIFCGFPQDVNCLLLSLWKMNGGDNLPLKCPLCVAVTVKDYNEMHMVQTSEYSDSSSNL